MKFFWIISLFAFEVIAKPEQFIQVQGNCEIKVTPDRGTITFTAENQSMNHSEAVKKTHDQIQDLKTKIQTLKLDKLELKNTQYHVTPVREYEKNRYVDKGTRASLTLEVTTSEISRIGETMVLAHQGGIQNVGSLQTFLSIEKSQAEYFKCLDIAASDALEKAQKLGHKLKFQVGKVLRIFETPPLMDTPRPYPGSMMLAETSMDSRKMAPQIEAGQEPFKVSLQVFFDIQ